MAQQENREVKSLENICEDITARITDGRFHFSQLTNDAKVNILIEAAEVYAYQAAYFASKTAILDKFPNDFSDWIETYYEIVAFIENKLNIENPNQNSAILNAYEEGGKGRIYELAEDWTNEFENKYSAITFGEEDIYFLEEIEKFLEEKDNVK